jgi:hypothetical protein
MGFLAALPLVFALNAANACDQPEPTDAQKEVLVLLEPRHAMDFNIQSALPKSKPQEEVIVTAKMPDMHEKNDLGLALGFEKPDFKQRIFEYMTSHIGLTKLELDKTAVAYQMYQVSERSRYEWLRNGHLQVFVGEGMSDNKIKPPQGMERLFKDDHLHDITYGVHFIREF